MDVLYYDLPGQIQFCVSFLETTFKEMKNKLVKDAQDVLPRAKEYFRIEGKDPGTSPIGLVEYSLDINHSTP